MEGLADTYYDFRRSLRPVGVIAPETMIDGFQHKAGDWIDEFVEQIEKRDFTFEAYLGEHLKTAEAIARL